MQVYFVVKFIYNFFNVDLAADSWKDFYKYIKNTAHQHLSESQDLSMSKIS